MPKSTRVTVVDLPQDDSWFRDTGPVVSLGTLARDSCCKSFATLQLGGTAKGWAWPQSGERSLRLHHAVCGPAG
jgi:agmatine/peptidylarginine deiminase